MRPSSLLLRGTTPPSRRLTLSVPAALPSATRWSAPQQGHASTPTTNTAVIGSDMGATLKAAAPRTLGEGVRAVVEGGCRLCTAQHSRSILATALARSPSVGLAAAVVACRAASAPLRVSQRCKSDGRAALASAAQGGTRDAGGDAADEHRDEAFGSAFGKHKDEEEEVYTSFGHQEGEERNPRSSPSLSSLRSTDTLGGRGGAKRDRRGAPSSPLQQQQSASSSSSPTSSSSSRAASAFVEESRAALSARIMRRHRLHSTQPYLAVSSGVDVPGCDNGPYHLQERLDTRGGAAAKNSAYAARVRSGGNNLRMSAVSSTLSPQHSRAAASSSSSSPSSAPLQSTVTPLVVWRDGAYLRATEYEPFERVFHRYLERGFVVNVTERLLHHPDAPAPAVLLDRILQHRVPSPMLTSQALLAAMHVARSDRSTAAAAAAALERVALRLRTDATCCVLYNTPDIRALLVEATLRESLFETAVRLVEDTPAEWVTPHAWALLVQAAGQSKLPHSQILWQLLSLRDDDQGGSSSAAPVSRALTRAGESALLRRVPLLGQPHTAAPAQPDASALSPEQRGTAAAAAASSAPSSRPPVADASPHGGGDSLLPHPVPTSETPLHQLRIPTSVFETRASSVVKLPASGAIGSPVFGAEADGAASAEADSGAAARAGGGEGQVPQLTASSTASALIVSPFFTGRARWCALSSGEVGYAAEHHNGDGAASAGDFRAVGAAGTLYGFPSFQALHAEVGKLQKQQQQQQQHQANDGGSREARRVLWETTALRMLHQQQGVAYGLDATTTARLLLRCGVGFSAQATPLLALQVLRRYVQSCNVLRDQLVAAQELVEAQLRLEEGTTRPSPAVSSASPAAGDATSSAVAVVAPTPSRAALRQLYPRLSSAVAPHPSPFLVFFKVMREAREVMSNAVEEEEAAAAAAAASRGMDGRGRLGFRTSGSLPMVHWEVVWHAFQLLNRENASWYTQLTVQEASDLCQDVIEVLCHGADPWLALNVTRWVSARHIMDGVDMALWLLHRLDPSHHTEEAREVARKLFRWLLVDVGLHLQPTLHHHLIPAARALIRLNLQDELRVLYSAVLDNVYLFRADHRDAFIQVLSDLICPACAAILPESDVYVDRACPNCMATVPAKDADTIPSFRLSAEHVERLRARRKVQRQRSRQRLSASVHRLQSGSHGGEANAASTQLRAPQDAAEVLRRHLLRSGQDGESELSVLASQAATFIPGVSVAGDVSLFPGTGGGAAVDVRAAMEESSRRLELQRAARQYTLAQRGQVDGRYADANTGDGVDGRSRAAAAAGDGAGLTRSLAAMPTTLPISAQALDAATLKYLSTAANATAQAGAFGAVQDGAWVCVWCQEKNTEWSSRVQCAACGAETGPAAPWRPFAYANPVSGDVMTELRGRMGNCEDRPVDAVVAGYMLMVYRRTFQLRATPSDHERLQRLIAMLCRLQERVLAGYVYTRLVPLTQRGRGPLLDLLAQTFGQENEPRYRALTDDDITRPEKEGVFFEGVFGPQACRVCFGVHDWRVCPIVTRDFARAATSEDAAASSSHPQRSPISLSPEEKQQAVLERLAQHIHQAARSAALSPATDAPSADGGAAAATASGKPSAQLVVRAYTTFVSSPFREVFAELHAEDANQLSLLLSRVQQYRRAAFVLCHVPPAKRSTEAYLRMVHFFNVTAEEALALLSKTGAATSTSTSVDGGTPAHDGVPAAPNFVQVTKTCCMCLDQRHASHECPRLTEWLSGVQRLATSQSAIINSSSPSSTAVGGEGGKARASTALVDTVGEARLRQRLRAQVDGWTTAGPERLYAFYRYLVAHLDLLRPHAGTAAGPTPRRMDLSDPLVYAVNKTIAKLATVERRAEAYRLYAHAPVECVSTASTAAVLRMNGFAEDSIRALLRASDDASSATDATAAEADADLLTARSSSSASALSAPHQHAPLAARTAAVPVHRCCLLCFSPAHTYVDCPELAAAPDEAARLLLVVREVGGIACVQDGIGAAAAYVYGEYNRGRMSGEMLRSHPELVAALLTLARRCFATHQLSHGVRVLRRVPVEMVPPASAYADLWRAAGLAEDEVEQRQSQLLALFDSAGLVPCVDPPPPRPSYTNSFLGQLSRTLHDGLCRHCFEHGHTIATCPLFHAEVSFGRDYVAAYRMSMMSEQLDRAWQEAYLLKLVDFFSTHYLFMPYHIAGVANALNAITAMWSFRGEPGIALRNLLLIPPAYRRRQAFKHVLHSLRVPSAEITRLLGDFYFAPDSAHGGGGSNNNSGSGGGSPQQAQQQQELVMAQHLLIPKPAIRDVARRQIFEQVPAAMAALEESTERMAQIRESHERRGLTSTPPLAGQGAARTATAAAAGVGISAHIQDSIHRQQQQRGGGAPVGNVSSVSAASFHSPVLRRVQQCGDVAQLREDFDPILAELEDAVGMRLGSRHTLFTSAMDILGAAAATVSSTPGGGRAASHTAEAASQSQHHAPPREKQPTSSSPSSSSSTASRSAPAVREAEVVVEVQSQTISRRPESSSPPHRQPPVSAPGASSSSSSTAPKAQQQQQQQNRRRQPTRHSSTASPPERAAAAVSAAQHTPVRSAAAGRGGQDEEVQSSFYTSAPASTAQQQQQRRRGDRAGSDGRRNSGAADSREGRGGRGERPSSNTSSSSSSNYRSGRHNNQRSNTYNRSQSSRGSSGDSRRDSSRGRPAGGGQQQ